MNGDMYARLVSHAKRVLPPDPALEPADLVHSAFVKALPWLDADRSEGEQMAYLFTAITNLARDRLRAHQRHPILPLADWHPSTVDVEDEAIAAIAVAVLVARAVADPLARTALYQALGYSGREVAVMCCCAASTVNTRVLRFRARELRA